MNKSDKPVSLYPFALISRHGTPQTLGYYILHEGLIGKFGDTGLERSHLQEYRGQEGQYLRCHQCLARHNGQILGRRAAAQDRRPCDREFQGRRPRHGQDLSDRLPARRAHHRARRDRRGGRAAIRRRQGSPRRQRLREQAQPQSFRSADRLGLVLLHHQAAVLRDRLHLPPGRQFRRRHPAGDRADQGRVLPARQQILRLDGEDEGGAAADDGAARTLRRRQGEAAASADGAVQEGEDQSAGRLSADRGADPGVLLALQGAVRHHRNAARAVLRLDPRPVGAGSDQRVQSVRPHSVRSDHPSRGRTIPASRRLAADHGRSPCGRR